MSDTIDVWVYPSRSCNFQCRYCYEQHDPSFMSLEMAERTVGWAFSQASLANAGAVSFSFFGGEPLLGLAAFERVVLHARQVARACGKRVEFRVNTNGSLITDAVAVFLAENRVALDLSLDGDRDTNDAFRKTRAGSSAYDAVGGVEKVTELRQLGVPVSVNMVVGPDTVRSLSRNVSFFWRHGIHALQALPMFDGGRDWEEEDLLALDAELKQIAGAIILGVAEASRTELLKFSPFSKTIRLLLVAEDPEAARRTRTKTYCGVGTRTFSVDVNGNIYSCPRFVHEQRIDRSSSGLIVGNVRDHRYDLGVVERFKRWNPRQDPRSPCCGCEYALTCIYQCLGENLAWSGDEYSVSRVVCRISAIVHKYALEIRRALYAPAPPRPRPEPAEPERPERCG